MSVIYVGRHKLIFEDLGELTPYAYILLSGTAQLTSYGLRGEGVVVAMISTGYLFTVPSLPAEVGHHFRWEAYNDCIVGKLPLESLINVALGSRADDFTRMAGTVNAHLGSLLARYPSFLGFSLRHRVAIALLELGSEFGIRDARGTLLRVVPTHRTLANLVGASRPKVTEAMRDLQRHRMIVREDHRLAISVPRLQEFVRSDTG